MVRLPRAFNHAIDGVIQNNPKSQSQRPLVSSLSGNLQRFGMERVAKVESLHEIIAEMGAVAGTAEDAGNYQSRHTIQFRIASLHFTLRRIPTQQ